MADDTLTLSLDTGNGTGGDVVIKLARTSRPGTSNASPSWRARASTTAWCFTA